MNVERTARAAVTRRESLRLTLAALAVAGLPVVAACTPSQRSHSGTTVLGPPDANGLRLPPGVTARVVARSGRRPVPDSPYRWHDAPDGGAVFPAPDGGWVYVSNSELPDGRGGAGALRFDAAGRVIAAYSILQGTHRNCAGGATPWGTWLSCEEVPGGRVWECDPLGVHPAVVRPALGTFMHEAVAVDPHGRRLYLTEDAPDGLLYRFTPASWPGLDGGLLEAARATPDGEGGFGVAWRPVPDPTARDTPTRMQVPDATPFRGGEGIAWHADAGAEEGTVWFTTKGDDRVWAYSPATGRLEVRYDAARAPDPVLTGVDNVLVTADGTVLVAEDGGDLQVVALRPDPGGKGGGPLVPTAVAQIEGHPASEITGIALDPSGTRLYFSSQRGSTGLASGGITYELSGWVPG